LLIANCSFPSCLISKKPQPNLSGAIHGDLTLSAPPYALICAFLRLSAAKLFLITATPIGFFNYPPWQQKKISIGESKAGTVNT
jgi:hypothetical protein